MLDALLERGLRYALRLQRRQPRRGPTPRSSLVRLRAARRSRWRSLRAPRPTARAGTSRSAATGALVLRETAQFPTDDRLLPRLPALALLQHQQPLARPRGARARCVRATAARPAADRQPQDRRPERPALAGRAPARDGDGRRDLAFERVARRRVPRSASCPSRPPTTCSSCAPTSTRSPTTDVARGGRRAAALRGPRPGALRPPRRLRAALPGRAAFAGRLRALRRPRQRVVRRVRGAPFTLMGPGSRRLRAGQRERAPPRRAPRRHRPGRRPAGRGGAAHVRRAAGRAFDALPQLHRRAAGGAVPGGVGGRPHVPAARLRGRHRLPLGRHGLLRRRPHRRACRQLPTCGSSARSRIRRGISPVAPACPSSCSAAARPPPSTRRRGATWSSRSCGAPATSATGSSATSPTIRGPSSALPPTTPAGRRWPPTGIRAARPNARIAIGGFSRLDRRYIGDVLRDPAHPLLGRFDIANVHVRVPLRSLPAAVSRARAFYRRMGFAGRLWVTEAGYPSLPAHQWDPAMAGGDAIRRAGCARAAAADRGRRRRRLRLLPRQPRVRARQLVRLGGRDHLAPARPRRPRAAQARLLGPAHARGDAATGCVTARARPRARRPAARARRACGSAACPRPRTARTGRAGGS